jgi:inorganic pyrophosphatase
MDFSKLKAGKDPKNGEVNVFVEIAMGSDVKYEVDEESGLIFVDRFLHTAMSYPFNYGFIPHSKGQDGDPADACIISTSPVVTGTVLPVKVIGLLEMEDEGGVDTKFIAVPKAKIDPWMGAIESMNDIDDLTKKKIKHFFDHMKELEPGKWVKTGEFKNKTEALKELDKSLGNLSNR